MDFYRKKYLKYKTKYLQYKKTLTGGVNECKPKKDYNFSQKIINRNCPSKLCYCNKCNNQKEVKYYILTNINNLMIDTQYIYAIKISEPNNIYYSIDDDTNQNSDKYIYYDCNDPNKITRALNHSCLVNNENVICAGEMKRDKIKPDTLNINNKSGHYQPDKEALSYVACLLNNLNIVYNITSDDGDLEDLED